jgi:phytoene desaturase
MIAKREQSVAVVGAGPGGLAAAMLLGASGVRVTVYEAMDRVGGRTSRISVGPYGFDRGPTFFLMPYVLEEIFRAAGRRLSDYADLRRLDPMYRLVIGNPEQSDDPWVVDTTQDVGVMSERIARIDERDAAAFGKFIHDNQVKLEAAEPILRRPIRSPLDLVRGDAMMAGRHIKPHLSVQQLLSKYFRHPAVRLAVSFQSKYLGMSPYDCPSLFTILPYIEYAYGVWHPVGGCNALMDAMAEVVREQGGTIRTGSPVQSIAFSGKRATGVVVDEELVEHDHVVINADATWAMKKLIPEHLRPAHRSDKKLDAMRYSCSTYMMYLGVDGEVELPHHTIYVSERYKQNLDDISTNGRLTEDPSAYVCNPSPLDPSLAPEGKSSLYVLVPTPNCTSGIDWSAESASMRERTLDQLERRFGIADVRDRIEAEHVITPDDWQAMNINHGATFNLAHNLGQMLHKRPHHRLEGFDGVWLVGGGTHPGSGLPVIFLSSQITARLLCEEMGASYAGDRAVPEPPESGPTDRSPMAAV